MYAYIIYIFIYIYIYIVSTKAGQYLYIYTYIYIGMTELTESYQVLYISKWKSLYICMNDIHYAYFCTATIMVLQRAHKLPSHNSLFPQSSYELLHPVHQIPSVFMPANFASEVMVFMLVNIILYRVWGRGIEFLRYYVT